MATIAKLFVLSRIFVACYRHKITFTIYYLRACVRRPRGVIPYYKRVITAGTRMMRCNINKCLVGTLYVGARATSLHRAASEFRQISTTGPVIRCQYQCSAVQLIFS